MNDGLVSIIIPVYNVKPYLCEALDSVLAQTYPYLEILIVDDGSTDGSGDICDEYARKDSRIRVIHQENQGQSGARNTALSLAKGLFLAFLDPDDAYHPEFVERLFAAMQKTKADVVICRFSIHHTAGPLPEIESNEIEPAIAPGLYDRKTALRELADVRINVSVWNKLYRRELWQDIRFPLGRVYEDLDTSYKIFDLCQSTFALDDVLYLHRKHPGSTTGSRSAKKRNDMLTAYRHFDAFVEENTPEIFTEEQLRKNREARLYRLLRIYIRYALKEGGEEGEELRREILATGLELDLRSFKFKIRAAYAMIRFCPWLLRVSYTLYHPVRDLVWRLRHK